MLNKLPLIYKVNRLGNTHFSKNGGKYWKIKYNYMYYTFDHELRFIISTPCKLFFCYYNDLTDFNNTQKCIGQ